MSAILAALSGDFSHARYAQSMKIKCKQIVIIDNKRKEKFFIIVNITNDTYSIIFVLLI